MHAEPPLLVRSMCLCVRAHMPLSESWGESALTCMWACDAGWGRAPPAESMAPRPWSYPLACACFGPLV